jgi:quinol monooxygenase YgiN
MLIVSGAYQIKPGKRDEFMKSLYEEGIVEKIRGEQGNIAYNYYYPYESETDVYFVEQWENRDAWEAHKIAPHVTGALKELKDNYMTGFAPGILGELQV